MDEGYHKDSVKNKLMELENRIAILEGKKPPHKKKCLRCNGTRQIYCYTGHQDWYEKCPECQRR